MPTVLLSSEQLLLKTLIPNVKLCVLKNFDKCSGREEICPLYKGLLRIMKKFQDRLIMELEGKYKFVMHTGFNI